MRRKVGLLVTIAICGVPIAFAICAWCIHFDWLRSGMYSHTSLPMNKVASDLSWSAAAACTVSTVIWWAIFRRDSAQSTGAKKPQ